MNNFYYGLSLLNTLYGINLDEDTYAEIALIGWGLIGNKRSKIYKVEATIGEDKKVKLPCNASLLEAVTLIGLEEFAHSTHDTDNGDLNSHFVESYIESRKTFTNPLYVPGKFVPYELVGDTLYFDKNYGRILITYKGDILDEDDLPLITDKEATALATYVAWIIKYKEALATNNAAIMQMATTLKLQWTIQCDLARIDHYLSQNELDEMLDAKMSSSRKLYNKSLKLYQ